VDEKFEIYLSFEDERPERYTVTKAVVWDDVVISTRGSGGLEMTAKPIPSPATDEEIERSFDAQR
jgi:hypothetical protein